MKKRLFCCLLAFALIVGVYLMGTQEVFATAVEQFSLWTTSLRYDLEITEPTLEELADGNGTFTATGVCSESVVGTDISVAVVFYDEQDEMVDYWKTSIILEEHNEITVSGTVPEYASVGVYFFESETMEPIRPSVMRLLDQQTSDSISMEQIVELESRLQAQENAMVELTNQVTNLEGNLKDLGYVEIEQKEFFNSGSITGTEGIGTIDMNGFGFILLKEWLTEEVTGVRVNLYLNGKTGMPVTCEVLDSSKRVINNLSVTDILNEDGEHIFDISFGADDIEEDFCYLAIYNADRENGYWLGFSTIDTSSEWYQKTSTSGISPIYLYSTQKNWVQPSSYPKRYFSLLFDEVVPVQQENVATKDYVDELLSGYTEDFVTKEYVDSQFSELQDDITKLEDSISGQGFVYAEQREFFNSGRITGTEGIGTIDMNGFGFILLKEWLTEEVTGVRVNLYLNGKTGMPVTCEVLDSSKRVINNLSVTDILNEDGEHIFDISFGADDIEEDFCYLAIYNADRENGYWLGFSTIDTSSEWYQKTSTSGISPIYLYGTQKNWNKPTSYPKRYFALLYDEMIPVELEDFVTKDYVDQLLSEYSIDPSYDMIQTADEYIAVEGDTLEIFYKSILHAKNPLNYNIHAYCKVGTSFQEKFVVPSTVSVGVYPLTLTITNDKGELIDQKTININVQKKAESPEKTVNVLCMGASTVQDGVWVNEFYRLLTGTDSVAVTGDPGPTGDGLTNINFIGKRTTNLGAGYEGFGGWSWGSYTSTTTSSGSYWVKVNSHSKEGTDQESIYKDANGVLWQLETIEETQLKLKKYGDNAGTMPPSGMLTYVSGGVDTSNIVYKSTEPEKGNPFCYNGKLDFKAYCDDIGASGIDYVYAQLVYNGTPSGTTVSQGELEKKVTLIRTFLIELLEDYPDAKLVLMNSPVPSYDGCGTNYTADSVFQNWWYMKDWLYKYQSVVYPMLKEEFPDNIYFCDYSAQFDIDHGYPTVTVAYNTRTSQTYQRQSNGVHPTNEGKMQCADATYRHLTLMLNEFPDHFTEEKEEQPTCAAGHSYVNGICADCGSVQSGPVIIKQPTDATAAFDEMFCATVEAQGEGLKYQWYYRNAGSEEWYKSGVKDNTYDDIMTKARNGREVYCVITDKYGNSVTTDIVKLIAVPKVELKVLSTGYESAAMGEMYCATVHAQGEGLTYQWYFRNAGSNVWYKSSVRDNTYDDVMTKARANRDVYCIISDAYGNWIKTEVITLELSE